MCTIEFLFYNKMHSLLHSCSVGSDGVDYTFPFYLGDQIYEAHIGVDTSCKLQSPHKGAEPGASQGRSSGKKPWGFRGHRLAPLAWLLIPCHSQHQVLLFIFGAEIEGSWKFEPHQGFAQATFPLTHSRGLLTQAKSPLLSVKVLPE